MSFVGGLAKNIGKNVQYTKQKLLQNIGVSEKSEDAEYNEMIARWEKFLKFLSHVEHYIKKQKDKHIIEMKSLKEIGYSIQEFYAESDEPRHTTYYQLYEETMTKLENAVMGYYLQQHELETNLHLLIRKVESIKPKIEERETALMDFDKYKNALASNNRDSRTERKFEDTKSLYDKLNEEVKAELNFLLNNRWALFDEQYRHIITNQFQLFAAIHNAYQQLYPIIAEEPHNPPSRFLPVSASSTPARLNDVSGEHSDNSTRNSGHEQGLDSTSSPTTPARVFGRPIEQAPANDSNIPIIVQQCVEFMSQTKNITEEGILRLSGSKLDVEKFARDFNEERDVEFTSKTDVHAVSGLLKKYFRELPIPLFPPPLHLKITATLSQFNNSEITSAVSPELLEESIKTELREYINQLPPTNYATFRYMILFLIQVIQNSAQNKMNLNNVITCISPSLQVAPGVLKFATTDYKFFFE